MRRFEIIDGAHRNARPCAILNWEDVSEKEKRGDASSSGGIKGVGTGAEEKGVEEEKESVLSIDINRDAGVKDVPMLFAPFIRAGKYHINDKWTRRWVQERIVPIDRQNLGEVLRANNLSFYDPMALFIGADGKCGQDDFFIREIEPADNKDVKLPSKKSASTPATNQAGQAIKTARQQAGMTQYELAKAAKITQPSLSNLENGHANPTVGLLEDIAAALGKSLVLDFN